MKKLSLIFLTLFITATAYAYYGPLLISMRSAAVAVCTPDYSDDFSTDTITAGDWVDDSGTWATSGAGDEEMVNSATSTQSFVRYATSVTDIEAYAKVTLKDISAGSNAGIFCRATGSTGYRYTIKYKESTNYLQWDIYNGTTYVDNVGEVAVTLSPNDEIAFIIDGIGNDTVVQLWVNPENDCPYNETNWDNSSDPADYTITDNPSISCDTGLVLGLFDYHTTGSIGFDDFTAGSFPGEPPVGGSGETHYVVEGGAGLQTGADLSNAFSVANFNNSANWDLLESDNNKIGPGDTVYFSGTITSEVIIQGSGTSDNWITLDGYAAGSYDPFSAGTEAVLINRGGSGYGISVGDNDISYITIKDFRITECDTAILLGSAAIGYADPTTYINIESSYFFELDSVGIDFYYASYVTIGGSESAGNYFYNVADVANLLNSYEKVIGASGHDFIISYNKFSASVGSGDNTDPIACAGWHSYNGLIERNLFNQVEEENAIDLKNGTHDVVIRFNIFQNQDEGYGLGVIHLNDYSYNNVIYGNYFTNNSSTNIDCNRQSHDNHIYSNVFYDNNQRAISSYESGDAEGVAPDDYFIVHNTIVGCASGGGTAGVYIVDEASADSYLVKGNILVGNGTSNRQAWGSTGSAAYWDYNHYYVDVGTPPAFYYSSATRTWAAWQSAGFDATGSAITDPLLNSDLTLQAGSPCIDGSTSISDATLPSITVMGDAISLSYADALDPSTWDTIVFPPPFTTVSRDTYGWDKGAFVYAYAAEAHYVTQSGAGDEDGTSLTNAFSVADFNDSGNWDTDVANDQKIGPDDTVYFSGTITSQIIPQGSGTSSNRITLDGYAADNITFKSLTESAGRAVIDTNDGGYGIYADSKSYITIQDFEITDTLQAIYLVDAHDVLIKRNYIHDIDDSDGIQIQDDSYNITIGGSLGEGNVLKNIGDDTSDADITTCCYIPQPHDIIISYNHLYATLSNGDAGDRGIDGITLNAGYDVLIEYNSIHSHNDRYGADAWGEDGIDLKRNVDDVVIRFNNIYDHDNGSEDKGGHAINLNAYPSEENTGMYIYGNNMYANRASAVYADEEHDDVYIFGNIIRDGVDGWGVVYTSGSDSEADDWWIFNNTFSTNTTDPNGSTNTQIYYNTNDGANIKNNIFYKGSSTTAYRQLYVGAGSTDNIDLDYNWYWWPPSNTSTIYWGGSGSVNINALQVIGPEAGIDANESDPGLTDIDNDDFRVNGTGSAVYGVGTDMGSGNIATFTINGVTVNVPWDFALGPNTVWGSGATLPVIDELNFDTLVRWDIGAYAYE